MGLISLAKAVVEKAVDNKIPLLWSYPPQESLGHLSLPCFNLSISSQELEKKLKDNKKVSVLFKEIKAFGPYLNFFFKDELILSEEFTKLPKQKGVVLVEYSNANTHKEYHIGHLRNISYGDSVVKILQAAGQEAKPISYINDFGINTAKAVWQLKQEKKEEKDKGIWIGKLYTLAEQKLKDNPDLKTEVSQVMSNIEAGQGLDYKLWKKSRQWSIDYFAKIYKELGIKFDTIFYEHEVIDKAKKTLDDLKKKGILKTSQGALIADLEKYNLGVLPFVRSDGTALYPVADLELTKVKEKKYHPKVSIIVVDIRQSLYFKQLFKVLELSGAKEKFVHLGYEFVSLPEGAMSSRSGRIVSYLQARDMAVDKAYQETKDRHKDWSEKKIKTTALTLALAALKFEMLKVSGQEEIVFNSDKALRFEGYTAAYIEYSYARLQSLKKKAAYKKVKIDWNKSDGQEELSLAWKICQYEEVIGRAANKYDPSEITKYLFELAKTINDYYQKVNILKSSKESQASKLYILNKAGQTIERGLGILGIKVLKEM